MKVIFLRYFGVLCCMLLSGCSILDNSGRDIDIDSQHDDIIGLLSALNSNDFAMMDHFVKDSLGIFYNPGADGYIAFFPGFEDAYETYYYNGFFGAVYYGSGFDFNLDIVDQLETNNDLQWQDICWLGDSDDYKPDVIASYDYDNNYQFVQDIIDINQGKIDFYKHNNINDDSTLASPEDMEYAGFIRDHVSTIYYIQDTVFIFYIVNNISYIGIIDMKDCFSA